MSIIEQKNAGSFDVIALLCVAASVCLALGALISLFGSYLKSLPGIFLFSGLLLMLASNGIFCVCFILESISESDLLGVIQCIFEVLFLISTFILLVVLIISCLNGRTASSAGVLPTVISLFAIALLVVRTFTTFASLSSALGSSFSWDKTSDLSNAVHWVLRSISPDSKYSAEMFYARLLERITLIMMYASFLTPIFRFSTFFKEYNIKMDISAEMPNARRNLREQKGDPFASGRFDLRTGLSSLRETEDTQPDNAEDDTEEEPDYEEDVSGFSTPDYIAGFDEPEKPFFPTYEYAEAPLYEPVVRYNTDMLDADYGKVIEETDSSQPQQNESDCTEAKDDAPVRTESGSYRVKLRSSIPSPDDKSIWDNYTE